MDYFAYGLAAFAGILMVVALVIMGFWLILYILNSIGFMTLAKNRGLSKPWLVWIPVVGSFTVGAVVDDIAHREGGESKFRFWLLGSSILSFLLSGSGSVGTLFTMISDPNSLYAAGSSGGGLATLGWLISIASYVLHIVALYRIFKSYRPHNATVWTVLCAIPLTAFMQSIFPFIMRNDRPVDTSAQSGGAPYPSGMR